MSLFRELPRVGINLSRHDFANAWRYVPGRGQSLAAAFARWLPAEHVFTACSGRAALCLILQTLAERSKRREVIVPAYTCPTVALSVARAGLEVRLCDVDPLSGNMDVARLAEVLTPNALAVIPVHMHSIPCDLPALLDLARQHNAFVVEDCAQAAGAMLGKQKVGTFGHAACFSLGRGKGFTAYEGGIGVGQPLSTGAKDKKKPVGIGTESLIFAKLLALAIFFHPRLYWIIRSLPLGWGNELYSENFEIRGMGRFQQGMARSLLARLDQIVAERRERAAYLEERLQKVPGVRLLKPPVDSEPSYPWLPLLVENRDNAFAELRSRGLGAARLFTHSLNQYEYLRSIVPRGSYPGGEYVATHLLTLPTHEYVTQQDLDEIVEVLGDVAQ